jgi:hypothetical protein
MLNQFFYIGVLCLISSIYPDRESQAISLCFNIQSKYQRGSHYVTLHRINEWNINGWY